jgi:hypothetical protein
MIRTSALPAVLAAALLCGNSTAGPFGTGSEHVRPGGVPFARYVNIIDGVDGRDSILVLGPELGLTPTEIARIRHVSGHVGCFLPSPSVGSGALFLSNRQILTAGHILFEASGQARSKCFFRTQDPEPLTIELLVDPDNTRFGATPPRAGSNGDYAIVRLAEPVPDGAPFPVALSPIMAGDPLIVVTAHPAGMQRAIDAGVPVVQSCSVRRVPNSTEATSFFRTDCDATGAASGSMNLQRVGNELVFRGITITTGPWQDERYRGAPYNERGGSVTTALGTDAGVLAAGESMADGR